VVGFRYPQRLRENSAEAKAMRRKRLQAGFRVKSFGSPFRNNSGSRHVRRDPRASSRVSNLAAEHREQNFENLNMMDGRVDTPCRGQDANAVS
jgi:hypothetical protein